VQISTGGRLVKQLSGIRAELLRCSNLPAYEAVDVAWVAVVKIANLLPGNSEHYRMVALLDRLPENCLRQVLQRSAVDALLNLDPLLESLLTANHERLNASRTAGELAVVRARRENDPKEALRKLADVLKRVRNRRAHGFKTPDGPRDKEILETSADILQTLGEGAVGALMPT
jgi:hypothetical protein